MAIVGIIIHVLYHFLYGFIWGWLRGADLSFAAAEVGTFLWGFLAKWWLLFDGLELLEDGVGINIGWDGRWSDSLSFLELLEHIEKLGGINADVALLLETGDD